MCRHPDIKLLYLSGLAVADITGPMAYTNTVLAQWTYDVIITWRRHFDVITWKWCRFGVITTSLLCNVSAWSAIPLIMHSSVRSVVCCRGKVTVEFTCRQTSNISCTINLLITQMHLEHRLSALLHVQLNLHSRHNTWFQCIGQRQLQNETRIIWVWGFGLY